jgi:hypothetical protein
MATEDFSDDILIDTLTNICIIKDLQINGNYSTNYNSMSTIGSKTGLRLYAGGNASATRLQIYNFSASGIFVEGLDNTNARLNKAEISFLNITNCQRGIWMADTNKSEHCILIGNQISQCYIGAKIDSANITINANNFSDNTFGWHSHPLNGRSHNIFSGNLINENKILFENCLSGSLVVGNSFTGNTEIDLNDPTEGVSFFSNSFESPTINDYSGSNIFSGNITLTLFNTTGSKKSIYNNNFLKTGQKISETLLVSGTSSITNDGRYSSSFTIILTNNITLSSPINATHGQKFSWNFLQNEIGNWSVSTTNFQFPTDFSLTINTNANVWSILSGYYNTNTSKIHVSESIGGF